MRFSDYVDMGLDVATADHGSSGGALALAGAVVLGAAALGVTVFRALGLNGGDDAAFAARGFEFPITEETLRVRDAGLAYPPGGIVVDGLRYDLGIDELFNLRHMLDRQRGDIVAEAREGHIDLTRPMPAVYARPAGLRPGATWADYVAELERDNGLIEREVQDRTRIRRLS
jgi:hypothetical protein